MNKITKIAGPLFHNLHADQWRAVLMRNNRIISASVIQAKTTGVAVPKVVTTTNWVCDESIQPAHPSQHIRFDTDDDSDEDQGNEAGLVAPTPPASSSSVDIIPQFTRADLALRNAVQLKKICDRFSIPRGKSKPERTNNILAQVEVEHGPLDHAGTVRRNLRRSRFPAPFLLQEPYIKHFNLVDLVNRDLKKADDRHRKPSWKLRMTIYILRIAVLNSFRSSYEDRKMHYRRYRHLLATGLGRKTDG